MNAPLLREHRAAEKASHVEQGLAQIREALLPLRFGSVSITIHEDRIVQIEVTEKKRLPAS